MDSSIGVTVFYCIALSSLVAAVAIQLPPTQADLISAEAIASSATATELMSPPRKLIGVGDLEIIGTCPVNFDDLTGYTELGSKCKTPPENECCEAFKALACPHSRLINNVSNGCADAMFSSIHTKGDLPPGTILEKCLEGPDGLKC
uniref:GPI-anchored protein LLG1-like domain-containing protein n=1 Tax=Leersia perrieri TaxID=77586 RepID=A0A0D9W6S4_9ORYZ